MNILLAKTAGFCFGVDRAVKLAEEAAASGRPAVTLGPIIHNRHVVQHLEQLGVGEGVGRHLQRGPRPGRNAVLSRRRTVRDVLRRHRRAC